MKHPNFRATGRSGGSIRTRPSIGITSVIPSSSRAAPPLLELNMHG